MGNVILLAVVAIPALLVLGALLLWRFFRSRDKRRSPLTIKVRNLPGEGLRRQMAKYDDAFNEAAAMAMTIEPIVFSAWLVARMSRVVLDWTKLKFGLWDALFVAMAVAMLAWAVWKMIASAERRRTYKQGLEAELAVAQSLTAVIANGGMVFHDFPADRFNIDHIVIGRSAVFAIETKSRKKPAAPGKKSAQVKYDGTRLAFPDHVDTKCVEQASLQAQWLGKFLADGIGEQARVIPLLALPGWFVDDTDSPSRPAVMVNNCHNPMFMVGGSFGPPMPEVLRKRIAHVLAERYPSIQTE